MKKLVFLLLIVTFQQVNAQNGTSNLQLKLFLQCLYIPNSQSASHPDGLMNPTIVFDSLYIDSLHIDSLYQDTSYYAYGDSIADSISVSLLDSTCNIQYTEGVLLNINGNCTIHPPNDLIGNYWILVRQRNHLYVFSKDRVTLGYNYLVSYDFTQPVDQAYLSDAQVQVGNNYYSPYSPIYALYCGDIDQSSYIDLEDFVIWENASANGDCGYLLPADLDGSGCVDLNDYIILETNITLGPGAQCPCSSNCP